jgi:hypothetical protein
MQAITAVPAFSGPSDLAGLLIGADGLTPSIDRTVTTAADIRSRQLS